MNVQRLAGQHVRRDLCGQRRLLGFERLGGCHGGSIAGDAAGSVALLQDRLVLQHDEHTHDIGVGIGSLFRFGLVRSGIVFRCKLQAVGGDLMIIRGLILRHGGDAGQQAGDHAHDQQQRKDPFQIPVLHSSILRSFHARFSR